MLDEKEIKYKVVSALVKKTTFKAVLLMDENAKEIWVPRSVMKDGEDIGDGLQDDFEVAEWFCIKEGL